jgi:hypothetical protein
MVDGTMEEKAAVIQQQDEHDLEREEMICTHRRPSLYQ